MPPFMLGRSIHLIEQRHSLLVKITSTTSSFTTLCLTAQKGLTVRAIVALFIDQRSFFW